MLPLRLTVTACDGSSWSFRLEVTGPFAHTAEFRGDLATDRFEQVRFPLRLVRTSLSGGRTSSRNRVCLLAQNASESPVLWLRVTRVGEQIRVGKTPVERGRWVGVRWHSDRPGEVRSDNYHIRVSPSVIPEPSERDALAPAAHRAPWLRAIDGKDYRERWFNWSSRGSPVTVRFEPLREEGRRAAFTIQN